MRTQSANRRGSDPVVLVVGAVEGVAETSLARFVADELACSPRSTSHVIAEDYERERGLLPGAPNAVRVKNRYVMGGPLGELGSTMAGSRVTPEVKAFCEGARMIEGCRRGVELLETLSEIHDADLAPPVLFVMRDGYNASDNTDARGLLEWADEVFVDYGTLDDLRASAQRVVAAWLDGLGEETT